MKWRIERTRVYIRVQSSPKFLCRPTACLLATASRKQAVGRQRNLGLGPKLDLR